MERITIGVDTRSNKGILISLLKNLRFVKWIEKGKPSNLSDLPISKFKNKKDFWDTFGLGKQSNINIGTIRKTAWRKTEL